jgi:hypothetical protein
LKNKNKIDAAKATWMKSSRNEKEKRTAAKIELDSGEEGTAWLEWRKAAADEEVAWNNWKALPCKNFGKLYDSISIILARA